MRIFLIMIEIIVGSWQVAESIDITMQYDPPLVTAYMLPDESTAEAIALARLTACEEARTADLPLPIPFSVRSWKSQEQGSFAPTEELVKGQVSICDPPHTRAARKWVF